MDIKKVKVSTADLVKLKKHKKLLIDDVQITIDDVYTPRIKVWG